MKNKEIEELLNELKEVTNSKKLSSAYCITNKHWQLLLSYIEQLEKDKQILTRNCNIGNEELKNLRSINKQLEKENEKANKYIDFYKDLTEKQNKSLEEFKQENKQLENNRNKAIEYNKNVLKENWYGGYEKENAQKNIDILKGGSDE
jgi:hypothetical protein